jgi:hypothetical protein
MSAAPGPTVHGEMHDRPYDEAVEALGAEFEALGRKGGASPDRGEEAAALAGWVALCLSAFGEVSEEMLVGEGDAMGRAADARESMLGAARLALDALEEVCGIERKAALRMVEDRLAAGGEFYTADELPPPSADAELHAAREAAVYELSLAGQAAAEIVDPELRLEFFVKGMVGFTAIAAAFSRNVRRWAASGG